MPRELVKIVCRAVVAERDGDRIVGEIESEPRACYTPAQLVAFFELAESEVATANMAEAELAKPPPRAQRRAAAKRKKPPA